MTSGTKAFNSGFHAQDDNHLPEGWVSAEVSQLMNLINGFPFKPGQWGKIGFPIIRIQNLNNREASFNHCSENIPEKFRVKRGDLLFAWSGTPGTSFGAHIWDGSDAWLNQHIFRVEFGQGLIDKRFLRHAINQNLDDYIHQAHGGAGLAHITKGKFQSSFIRLPPLAEQQRIVAKVEALLASVNAAGQRLANVPTILKRFRQSVLAAACSGRLTAECRPRSRNEWERCQLGDLIVQGPQNGLYKPRSAYGEGTLIVRIDNFYDGRIHAWNRLDRLRLTQEEVAAFTLRNGDILVNRVNSLSFLGKSAIVANLREPCVFESNMMRFCLDSNRVSPFYLIRYLTSPQGLVELRKNAKHAVNQASINQKDVADALVPLPPLAEQHEIVCRVDALFKLADTIKKRVAAARARAEKLTQAILAKAFRGELVPTEAELARKEGRDYEPASALLERIRAERASQREESNQKPKRQRKQHAQSNK